MSKSNFAESELLPSPLCCRYLLAVLVDVSATWLEGDRDRDEVLRWGVGLLPDGEREFLGVWHGADAQAPVWAVICQDLKVRGVDSIRFVIGSDPIAFLATFLGVTVLGHLPSHVEADLLCSLAPRHRRAAQQSIDVTNHLNQRLTRVVARRGCFPSAAAAASFAVAWITRAQRDFDFFGVDAAHLATRPTGTSRIAGPGA